MEISRDELDYVRAAFFDQHGSWVLGHGTEALRKLAEQWHLPLPSTGSPQDAVTQFLSSQPEDQCARLLAMLNERRQHLEVVGRVEPLTPALEARLDSLLDRLSGPTAVAQSAGPSSQSRQTNPVPSKKHEVENSVFIVHGRDHEARDALEHYLRAIGITVIDWKAAKAMKSGMKTNAEIVRFGIDAAQAVLVLFTPDEIRHLRPALNEKNEPAGYQPRPNVLFEAGWAFGAHHEKTLVIEVGMSGTPLSDLDGFNNVRLSCYEDLDHVASELRTIGVEPTDDGEASREELAGLFREPLVEPGIAPASDTTFILRFEKEDSSREYWASKMVEFSLHSTQTGAKYRLPGLSYDFIVEHVRQVEDGSVEVWSRYLSLTGGGEFPDGALRRDLEATGWHVEQGPRRDAPEDEEPPEEPALRVPLSDDSARQLLKNAMVNWRDALFRTWEMMATAFPAGNLPPAQIRRIAAAAAADERWQVKAITEEGMSLEVAPHPLAGLI